MSTYLQELIPQRKYDRIDYLGALRALLPRGAIWYIPLPDEKDVSPYGIASQEAFGRVTISQGQLLITTNAIGSGEAFGSPIISIDEIILASGISSGESWGTLSISN